ncbi:MAG: hypothetical protein HY046_13865 [Acidobacteria bacterium]|nr:hypothetical protein [Acidobacteriota bacterium]
MKVRSRKATLTIAVLFACGYASAQLTTSVSATGFLTDTHCGRRGATALHIDCAKRKVAAGKAQYAIFDEKSKRLYVLDTPDAGSRATIESYLGQRLRITGTLVASPLRASGDTIAPPDPKSLA